MSEQFLSPQNVCGKTLLDLVARGSAILAEMQRLSFHIPKIFSKPDKKYQKIIYDFSYFKNMNTIQDNIQKDQDLVQINQNIKNTYLPLLQRFYKLFQSIYTYYDAINGFIQEIQTGVFMQFSLENMLQIMEGKQLICQAIYLFGVMLLLLDQLIEGPIRQRIVLCYYRNKGGENISKINEVRKLATDSYFRIGKVNDPEYVRPQNYPEDYFARFPFSQQIIESIILAIKDDDIYRQMAAYPKPNLRSFALSNQGSMIFVILFFMPSVLNKARSTMRQIVDKHFYNTWVLPFYLGYIIDLTYWWKPYKAAKLALQNILDLQSITELTGQFVMKQTEYYRKCKQYLTEGVMSDQFVLHKINALMNCLRQSNVALRWLMLHRKTSGEKLKEIVLNATNAVDIMKLLLITAEFENILKMRCQSLIERKQEMWEEDKQACIERMRELAIYYGGQRSLGKIQADQSFKRWFEDMADAIDSVSFTNSTYACRKIQDLIKALEDIEQYHQISSSIQIKQYLQDTQKDLDHMIKIVNVNRTTLISIQIICDITWSWTVIKDYIQLMQREVKKDPDIALLLKNTFTKLSSILNTPMVRLMQAQSPDIQSVSQFYSNQLVKLVKNVLQIIPQSVFQILGSIIQIFTNKLEQEPQKFDKAELVKYSQYDHRLSLCKYTTEISVFAESILNMETYLVGVIEVNPKDILEAGIRKELIRLIAQILEEALSVESPTPEAFLTKLINLGAKLKSFKLSLEYIQDFIHIYGLKMFFQQFEQLIYSYVDMEKVTLMEHRAGFQELSYDDDIPMPTISNENYNTFMGCTLIELIKLTSPKKCTFLLASYGFYNIETGKQSITIKTLNILHQCIGISGLQGLDHLLSFKIMDSLRGINSEIVRQCQQSVKKILNNCYNSLKNVNSFTERYDEAVSTMKKALRPLCNFLTAQLIKIGQYVLLKDMLCLQLRMLSKVGSNRLYLTLQNLNASFLNDMINRPIPAEPQNQQALNQQNLLISLINPYLSLVGMMQPIKKIFITAKQVDNFPLILFTLVAVNISNMDYDKHIKSLVRVNKKQPFQPNYFLAGLLCLLNQFHHTTKLAFFSYLASYIKSTVNYIIINKEVSKNPQLISDLFTYIRFFQEAIKFSRQSYQKYKEIIDLGLFSSLDKETLKSGYRL